jgi:hypothetical protein
MVVILDCGIWTLDHFVSACCNKRLRRGSRWPAIPPSISNHLINRARKSPIPKSDEKCGGTIRSDSQFITRKLSYQRRLFFTDFLPPKVAWLTRFIQQLKLKASLPARTMVAIISDHSFRLVAASTFLLTAGIGNFLFR